LATTVDKLLLLTDKNLIIMIKLLKLLLHKQTSKLQPEDN